LKPGLLVPFLRPEEKHLIFLDGAANGIAEVVAAQLVLHAFCATSQTAGLDEGIKRIQFVVATEIVDVAVKFIVTALGKDADLGTGRTAKLGAVAVRSILNSSMESTEGKREWCGWSRRHYCERRRPTRGWRPPHHR